MDKKPRPTYMLFYKRLSSDLKTHIDEMLRDGKRYSTQIEKKIKLGSNARINLDRL